MTKERLLSQQKPLGKNGREKKFVKELGNFMSSNWDSLTLKEIDFLFNMGRDRKYIIMLQRKGCMLINERLSE